MLRFSPSHLPHNQLHISFTAACARLNILVKKNSPPNFRRVCTLSPSFALHPPSPPVGAHDTGATATR